jgi:hypothetical protein
MKKLFTSAFATAALATLLAASTASANLAFTQLTLINGWKTYSSFVRAPKVAIDADGVVHFLGAIKQPSPGTDDHPFTLPAQFRPAKTTYAVADMCNGAAGRFRFEPDGEVVVQADKLYSDAQCLTSLEGVTFAK